MLMTIHQFSSMRLTKRALLRWVGFNYRRNRALMSSKRINMKRTARWECENLWVIWRLWSFAMKLDCFCLHPTAEMGIFIDCNCNLLLHRFNFRSQSELWSFSRHSWNNKPEQRSVQVFPQTANDQQLVDVGPPDRNDPHGDKDDEKR